MFTGLIQATGTILSVSVGDRSTRITVSAPGLASRLRTGDSVAVSGVCLTALDIGEESFSADLAAETVARTTLSRLVPGGLVNLELPTPAGAPMGGHIVQGHVDGTATLVSLSQLPTGDWRLHLRLPSTLSTNVVPQGSITVEGISLTVAALRQDDVEVAIIPHTYSATSLHTLSPGALLNIETDVLAKYAAKQNKPPRAELTEAYLLANGY